MSAAGTGLSKLSAREQRLLTLLGIVGGIMLLIGLPVYLYMHIADVRAQNDAYRKALKQLNRADAALAVHRQERDALALRYATPAPPLAGLIESAAKANSVTVPESKDRPPVAHGKRYTERTTVVKLRNVGLVALAKTLEKIELGGHPVAITLLHVKTRSEGPDAYDVDLGVSAFDRKAAEGETAAPAPAPSASASASSRAVPRPRASAPDGGAPPDGGARTKGQRL